MKLSEPMEDYLEIILSLSAARGMARVKDIAAQLKVTTPSVVSALRKLKKLKLIDQESYGFITLTPLGKTSARRVAHRHEVLTSLFTVVLGLDPVTAAADACRIEHAVSARTFKRLEALSTFLASSAHADLDWPHEFASYCAAKAKKVKP
jgi:DtxR family transcriptional regulator, Mn-dependent transcriptional regulator